MKLKTNKRRNRTALVVLNVLFGCSKQVAAGNIEPEPVVLSEMARVTDAVLQENREEVQEAAKILEKVIDLSAESGGAGEQVATAILGAESSFMV